MLPATAASLLIQALLASSLGKLQRLANRHARPAAAQFTHSWQQAE
jgi:hypothetical protein